MYDVSIFCCITYKSSFHFHLNMQVLEASTIIGEHKNKSKREWV